MGEGRTRRGNCTNTSECKHGQSETKRIHALRDAGARVPSIDLELLQLAGGDGVAWIARESSLEGVSSGLALTEL